MKSTDLRTAREERGWSMDDLAAEAGVSKATISRLEGGKTSPNYSTIEALEKALRLRRGTLVFAQQMAKAS